VGLQHANKFVDGMGGVPDCANGHALGSNLKVPEEPTGVCESYARL
jgi:hypothetical protein